MKSIGMKRSKVHVATLLVATLGLVSSACSFHVAASTKTGGDAKSSDQADGANKSSSGRRSGADDDSNNNNESSSSSGSGKGGSKKTVSIKASGKGGILFASKGRTKDIARSSKGDDFAATDLVGGGSGTSGSGGGKKTDSGNSSGGGKGNATGGGKVSGGASSGGKGTDDKGSAGKGSDGKGSTGKGSTGKGSTGSTGKGSDGKGSGKGEGGDEAKDYDSGSAQVQSGKRRPGEKAGADREKNSQKPHEQEKPGAAKEKNADKKSSKGGDKSANKDEKKDVVVIDPPAQPPENAFGYEKPVRGCFEGVVYPLATQTKRLPLDFGKLKGISVVYACEWDIPVRAWSQGFPGVADRFEWFAIQYKGSFAVEKAGTWEFRISSDDGAKLYIDGKLVLDNDGEHPPRERKARLHLSRGDHDMVLQYFQGPRYHINLQLFATPPGEQEGIFSVR